MYLGHYYSNSTPQSKQPASTLSSYHLLKHGLIAISRPAFLCERSTLLKNGSAAVACFNCLASTGTVYILKTEEAGSSPSSNIGLKIHQRCRVGRFLKIPSRTGMLTAGLSITEVWWLQGSAILSWTPGWPSAIGGP